MADPEEYGDALARLDDAMGDAGTVTRVFASELVSMRSTLGATIRDLGELDRGFSSGLRRAFDGVILDGRSLSDALRGLAASMADTVYSAALRPVTTHVGGIMAAGLNNVVAGLMPHADGAPFSQGRVMPFARGGVLSGPVAFPMRGGTGLMGEAGPEAIMPLARGPDGRLGVQAAAGRSVHVTMNIATPDVAGFQRSQSQIAARMGRLMAHGARNR
ncbi:phage tail tape measure protein [Wenxinia saemankumensis]|uniref:Phage tail tape measure protein, lambda family n=1 Tax=Wenxinia saemankumensis TaxID=1447782 RepID=A0A1M6GMT7_9RHOB|nr:phage tail tape measure protein [Wenxinia saemankumensis]SHJ11278.1 phage tail tape measure protein, lambda family [Wenxinia saemankumensis]